MVRPLGCLLLLFTACATPLGGDLRTLTGVRPHATPPRESAVPLALTGDWAEPGQTYRFRFDSGGRLFVVQSLPYTVDAQTLRRGAETYTRTAGTAGLPGVWRTSFPEGEWLELTLGAGGFYEAVWNDGLRSTGAAIVEGEQLTIVEHRADFECHGQTLHFRPASGEPPSTAKWSVSGDELTLTFADGPHTWRRIKPY